MPQNKSENFYVVDADVIHDMLDHKLGSLKSTIINLVTEDLKIVLNFLIFSQIVGFSALIITVWIAVK
jgi:hypothetical protein